MEDNFIKRQNWRKKFLNLFRKDETQQKKKNKYLIFVPEKWTPYNFLPNLIINFAKMTERMQDTETISVAAADNLLAIPSDVYQSINQTLELKCLLDAHAEQLNEDANRYCPTSFDSILCWPRTPKGSLATLPCLAELSGVHYDISKNASRFCHSDGNWDNYTNYDQCQHVPESSAVSEFEPNIELPTIVYYTGYSISLISLTLAVAVFVHFNLTNFFWMLVEGLYLYMLVVETFSGDNIRFSMYAVIGYGGPALFVLSWAIVKAFTVENENLDGLAIECTWMRETNIDWIFQGPACAVLIINLIFLCRIMWVLITKLRSANTLETRQYRKATKALLVLIPLLGITYLVVMAGPNEGVGSYIFAVARALLLSTQGFSVSLLYCFLNSDVRTALRHRFNRWKDERNIRIGQTRQSQRYTAT
ncbi:Diuretic hormone receptor, partial [Pseudolycoriella hygida]